MTKIRSLKMMLPRHAWGSKAGKKEDRYRVRHPSALNEVFIYRSRVELCSGGRFSAPAYPYPRDARPWPWTVLVTWLREHTLINLSGVRDRMCGVVVGCGCSLLPALCYANSCYEAFKQETAGGSWLRARLQWSERGDSLISLLLHRCCETAAAAGR